MDFGAWKFNTKSVQGVLYLYAIFLAFVIVFFSQYQYWRTISYVKVLQRYGTYIAQVLQKFGL